jgi:hypothetical protein
MILMDIQENSLKIQENQKSMIQTVVQIQNSMTKIIAEP